MRTGDQLDASVYVKRTYSVVDSQPGGLELDPFKGLISCVDATHRQPRLSASVGERTAYQMS